MLVCVYVCVHVCVFRPQACVADLVLHVLVTQLQLHDVLKGAEQRLVEVKVRKLRPAGQDLGQDVVKEGHGLLGNVTFLVARSLGQPDGWERGRRCYRSRSGFKDHELPVCACVCV